MVAVRHGLNQKFKRGFLLSMKNGHIDLRAGTLVTLGQKSYLDTLADYKLPFRENPRPEVNLTLRS